MDNENLYNILPTNFRRLLKQQTSALNCTSDDFYLPFFGGDEAIAIENNLKADQWGRGFVLAVHDKIINSGTGPRIVKAIKRKTIGSQIRIECSNDENNENEYKYLDCEYLTSQLSIVLSLMLTRGQCLIRVKKDVTETDISKAYSIKAFPLLRYKYTLNSRGKIIECSMFIKSSELDKATNFILTEKRFFDLGGVPKQVYTVNRFKISTDNGGITRKYSLAEIRNSEDIKAYEAVLKRVFPDEFNSIGKVVDLPFKDSLGVYVVNNSDVNLKCPYSTIGESQFMDAMDLMMQSDTAATYKELDKYMGKGMALIPQGLSARTPITMQSINAAGRVGGLMAGATNALDNTLFTTFDSGPAGLTAPAVPTIYQHNLRTEEWWKDLTNTLSQIASACGVSIIDIDPSQSNGDYRNEADIDSQTNLSVGTATEKRRLIGLQANKMLNDIAKAENETFIYSIRWSAETYTNAKANTELATSKYNSGVQSLEQTVKEIHPDWSKKDIEVELEKLTASKEKVTEEDLLGKV